MTMKKTAIIDPTGVYRYRLGRRWEDGPTMAFVMLNPSTADAEIDDPTIRRCIGFARDQRCKAIEVVNLFALRATDPNVVKAAIGRSTIQPTPHRGLDAVVGPENDEHIREVVSNASAVIVAWGAAGFLHGRDHQVLDLIERSCRGPVRPHALALTKGGAPRHPLYLPAAASPVPFIRSATPAR